MPILQPLHRAQKSTACISTGGKPPRVTPSELRWLSLSPAPSTTSVEGYIMSTDRTPLQALPPVPCPFMASSMASVASTSSTPSSTGSHTWGPDFASTSSAASHTGIQTADGPNGPYDPEHGHTCVKPNQVLPFLKMFTPRIPNTGSPTHGHTRVKPNQVLPFLQMLTRRIPNMGSPTHGHTRMKPNQVLPFLQMLTPRIPNTGSPTHVHTHVKLNQVLPFLKMLSHMENRVTCLQNRSVILNEVLSFLKMFTRRILNTGSPTHGHTHVKPNQDPEHRLSDTWTHMRETKLGPSIPENVVTHGEQGNMPAEPSECAPECLKVLPNEEKM
ncbi:hypothetical protein JB92DRAFT_3102550 [Gautieria morchelliformis]|nr:hypothetical protein JB92DRAFT_3102550 [Gautieria morchelliformis]